MLIQLCLFSTISRTFAPQRRTPISSPAYLHYNILSWSPMAPDPPSHSAARSQCSRAFPPHDTSRVRHPRCFSVLRIEIAGPWRNAARNDRRLTAVNKLRLQDNQSLLFCFLLFAVGWTEIVEGGGGRCCESCKRSDKDNGGRCAWP